jgi:hypothetical protein
MALRDQLITQIVTTFPNDVSIIKRGGRWRSQLRFSNGPLVSVLVARSLRAWKETIRWQIDPIRRECKFITILTRLDANNRSFLDFHVFPRIDRRGRFRICLSNPWLEGGKRLTDLTRLCEVVEQVRLAKRGKFRKELHK